MFSCQIDENLKFTLPQPRHAREITTVVRANPGHLKKWMPWTTESYSIDSAHGFIKHNLMQFAETGSFSASVVLNGKFSGAVGFHNLDLTNKSAHIGYWLVKEAEGKGIMTRCCGILIDYLFDDLELNRIQINCNVENDKSCAIPERLGFTMEGIQRQVEILNGRFGDWAVYAMLRENWKTKN